MKKRYTIVLTATILIFVSMLAVVGIMASYLLSYTPDSPNLPKETVIHYDEYNNPIVVNPLEDETYNFLVLGHDRAATLTDVIMLINYNVTEGKIAIMQFPRDTYVSYGVATNRINASYATFFNEARDAGSKQPELDALRKFADILEKALCTKISYTAIMNLDGFRNIVDAIGGVEVNVPHDIYHVDELQGLYINLKAGLQTLNGDQAEQFVRCRSYLQADHGRQDAQKIFMSAFIKKVQESIDATKLTVLAESVLDNLYTDITVSEFVYFGKNLLKVDRANITMVSMPSDGASYGNVIMVRCQMVELMNKYFNVYDGEIIESIFDKSKVFVNEYDSTHTSVYYSEEGVYGGTEYSADEINQGQIHIPK